MSYQNSTIFVVHIPKAAGTTLRVIMERQYPAQNVYTMRLDVQAAMRAFEKLSDEQKRAYRVVFGHQPYGLHRCMPAEARWTYITLLRDPVERVNSLWFYARGSEIHYLYEIARTMVLYDFVASGITATVDNAQVRQLCGDDLYLTRGGIQYPYRDMLIPYGGVTREHLEKAKANIEQHFAFAGTVERFDESLDAMRRLFAWRIPAYESLNVARRKPKLIGSRARRAIEERNELDYELYNWVVERMKRRGR